MRYLFLFLILISLSVAEARTKFEPRLLSYNQVVALTPAKREIYLKNLRKLMVMIEKHQIKYQLAENEKSLSDQVASMIQSLSLLPTAEAQTQWKVEELDQMIASWDPVQKTWVCPAKFGLRFSAKVGTCILAEGDRSSFPDCSIDYQKSKSPWHPDQFVCVPRMGAWKQLDMLRKGEVFSGIPVAADAFTGKTAEETRAIVMGGMPDAPIPLVQGTSAPADTVAIGTTSPAPTAVVTTPLDTSTSTSTSTATDALCAKQIYDCKQLSKSDYDSLRSKYRDSNICISGGFFSDYQSGTKKLAHCRIVREFPQGTGKKLCDNTEALCNPSTFCLMNTVDGKTSPAFHCEGYGGKAGYNVTERCEQWYNGQLGQPYPNASAPSQACDSKQFSMAASTRDAWEEMNNALITKYKNWCVNDAGFQQLFCTECNKMSEHMYAMMKDSVGNPCASGAELVDESKATTTD